MVVNQLCSQDISAFFPPRRLDSHKGDFGRILLICGSKGYTGAAELSAMGALRCGAGLVYLAVPESIYSIEATKLTEPIVLPLPDRDGMLAPDASRQIRNLLIGKDAVLIGPGLGISDGTLQAVKTVLTEYSGPVVLDADGINLISRHKDILRGRTAPTIITPHAGEFSRLAEMTDDRITSAVSLARQLRCIVLLKGHESIICDEAQCFINSTGNPGMAVGGSGDLLAGMITSLLGQKFQPIMAAACGAWLHGRAGDLCAAEIGEYGMLPTDMLQVLPRLLK